MGLVPTLRFITKLPQNESYTYLHYQNMHLAGDDEEYASSQEPEDLPINRREKRAWIPHGGRRQRNG